MRDKDGASGLWSLARTTTETSAEIARRAIRAAGSFPVASQGRDKKICDHILRTRYLFNFLKDVISKELAQADNSLRGRFLRKQMLQTAVVGENFELDAQK